MDLVQFSVSIEVNKALFAALARAFWIGFLPKSPAVFESPVRKWAFAWYWDIKLALRLKNAFSFEGSIVAEVKSKVDFARSRTLCATRRGAEREERLNEQAAECIYEDAADRIESIASLSFYGHLLLWSYVGWIPIFDYSKFLNSWVK